MICYFKYTKALLSLALILGLALACTDHAYDFDRLDKSVTIAGGGVAMPLGSTKQMTVGSLIGDNMGDLLTVGTDGSYSINYEANPIGVDLTTLEKIEASLSFGLDESDPVKIDVHLFDKPEVEFTGEYGEEVDLSEKIPLTSDVNRSQEIDITIKDMPEELASIEAMTLQPGAKLNIAVAIPDCMLSEGTIHSALTVDFSQIFELHDVPGNILNIEDIVLDKENGYIFKNSYALDNIIFDSKKFNAADHSLNLLADVGVTGSYVIENPFTTQVLYNEAPVENHLEVTVSVDDAYVKSITGRFNYQADPVKTEFDVRNLSEKLGVGDVVLDFSNPEIVFDINSNVSVPAVAVLDFIAKKGGKNIATIENIKIDLPLAEPGKTATRKVRIAKDGDIKADVGSLLKNVPERIAVHVDASTDNATTGYLELGSKYHIDVTPSVNIPLALGPDFKIEFRDTLSMPASLGKIIKDNPMRLLGDITNTIPAAFNLDIVMTDGSYKALTNTVSQKVAAEGKSDIDMTISNTSGAAIENLAHAIMTFKLSSPGDGKAIKSTDYIQANLSAELPEGIRLTF